jgi:dTDP-4-amino-4,6-dideoxygalactose transaminase
VPGEPARSYQRVGHNYRLAELLAWWGQHQAHDFEQVLTHRRWQTRFVLECLHGQPGIALYQHAPAERPNGFSPILLLDEALIGRGIAQRLATQRVANSVGTFGLRPVHKWPLFAVSLTDPVHTPHAQQFLSRVLAISLLPQYTAEDLLRIINTIKMLLEEEMT